MLLNSCCCGIPLQDGTTAIGIVSIVRTLTLLIPIVVGLTNDMSSSSISSDAVVVVRSENSGAVVGSVVSLGGSLVVAIFLLVAASKNKRMYLLPWLILSGIGIIATPIIMVLVVVIIIGIGEMVGLLLGVFLGVGIPLLVMEIYFWMVIYSYYQKLIHTSFHVGEKMYSRF